MVDVTSLTGALADHARSSGLISPMLEHEPLSSPGSGVSGAVWFLTAGPARGASGLAATTALIVFQLRLYTPISAQPGDAIDPALTRALDWLMSAYHGDFTLTGAVREIDLLGQFGTPLSARSAYQTIGGDQYRVITITVPLVVNDAWQQAEEVA